MTGILKAVGAVLGVIILIAGAGLLLFIYEFGRFVDDISPIGWEEGEDEGGC